MEPIKITILNKQVPLKVEANKKKDIQQMAHLIEEKVAYFKSRMKKVDEYNIIILVALSFAEQILSMQHQKNVEQGCQDIIEAVEKKLVQLEMSLSQMERTKMPNK